MTARLLRMASAVGIALTLVATNFSPIGGIAVLFALVVPFERLFPRHRHVGASGAGEGRAAPAGGRAEQPGDRRRPRSLGADVKTHVSRILAKLGVRDRVQAVVVAHESGFVR